MDDQIVCERLECGERRDGEESTGRQDAASRVARHRYLSNAQQIQLLAEPCCHLSAVDVCTRSALCACPAVTGEKLVAAVDSDVDLSTGACKHEEWPRQAATRLCVDRSTETLRVPTRLLQTDIG